jgi:RNA polymerase sigma-70 factor (ECF subfamily)
MDWRQVEPTEKSALPEHAIGQEETFAELAAALDRLSPAQRRVLLLRYYGSLSFAEIAATMDCPLGTVLSHCHRGLLTLKNLLVETDK